MSDASSDSGRQNLSDATGDSGRQNLSGSSSDSGSRQNLSDRVLLIDDDPDVRSVVEITLMLNGFEVETAADGQEGIDAARRSRPDIVVLDLMMPNIDGYEVTRQLRADGRTSHIPIIMLTAKAQLSDKVTGLEHGADDYLTKPFDTDELVARVQATLRRSRATGSLSPLTGLPGNVRIEQELARRVGSGEHIGLLYADLNLFKAYNDHYGFLRGDQAIALFGRILSDVAGRYGGEDTFVGHIGGDDFVVITHPSVSEQIADVAIKDFDASVPALYDPEDRERGYIAVEDRKGDVHRYPPLSVSIGVVTTEQRNITDYRELVEIATEMKNYAKRTTAGDGSNFAVDRRTE